jgi:O-antigen/teichoic acid export membrane protein
VSIKRNFSIGLLSSIWNAALGLVVVPFYLKYLGTEAYGLIGFFATTQALLQLLDLGLSPAVNREVARCSASGKMQEARNVIHTLAIVYWSMAIIIALISVILAPFIASHWLNFSNLNQITVVHALTLMGVVVACRWPVGLYMGVLMGMQKIALSSVVGTIAATLSSLGGIAMLAFVSPTIEIFFIWQACVGVVYAVAIRRVAWCAVGDSHKVFHFDLDSLKRIWRFSAGMSGIAVTGVVLIQMDKVLLSKFLSLEDFGFYMIAGVLANGLYTILTPLFNALYPRMTVLVASKETNKLIDLYNSGTRLFLVVFFPIVAMAAFYSEDLLYIWTRNADVSKSSSLIASLLLIGTSLNGVMHFPFALQLANGVTRLPLTITVFLIIVLVPIFIPLTLSYGAVGGASAWLILNVTYLIFGTWLTHREILKGIALYWLIYCVGVPFLTSLVVLWVGCDISPVKDNNYLNFIWGSGFMLLAILINLLLLPRDILLKIRLWMTSLR